MAKIDVENSGVNGDRDGSYDRLTFLFKLYLISSFIVLLCVLSLTLITVAFLLLTCAFVAGVIIVIVAIFWKFFGLCTLSFI